MAEGNGKRFDNWTDQSVCSVPGQTRVSGQSGVSRQCRECLDRPKYLDRINCLDRMECIYRLVSWHISILTGQCV